jgi:hypothetical protein
MLLMISNVSNRICNEGKKNVSIKAYPSYVIIAVKKGVQFNLISHMTEKQEAD